MTDIIDHPNKRKPKLSEEEKARRIKEGIANSGRRGSGKGAGSLDAIKKRQQAAIIKRKKLDNFDQLKDMLTDKFEAEVTDEEAMVLLAHYLKKALDL